MRRRAPARPKLNRSALPEILTLDEVGEVLGSSRDAVRKMVRRRRLRAAQLGRRLYVRREWLYEALDAAYVAAFGSPAAPAGGGA